MGKFLQQQLLEIIILNMDTQKVFFLVCQKFLQLLDGNTNTYLANYQELTPPIVASKVRFVPQSVHSRTVCMRVEVFGCKYSNPVVSYTVRKPDEFAENFYLDDIYDGPQRNPGLLAGGLGLLTDGLLGGNITLFDHGLTPSK